MFACIVFVWPQLARAIELTGAWAADAGKCDKVFLRGGRSNAITFARFPGVHGGGFIIDGDQLRSKFAKCVIRTRKQDGDSINLIAGCATDIVFSNVQFILKVIDDDTITRVFPGIDGMDVRYHRCRL